MLYETAFFNIKVIFYKIFLIALKNNKNIVIFRQVIITAHFLHKA